MFLEIISPEKIIYSGEVNSVAVPGVQGEFEMLNNRNEIEDIEGIYKTYNRIVITYDVRGKENPISKYLKYSSSIL